MKKNIYKKPTIGLLCIKVMFLCGSKGTSLSPGTERGDASQADAKRAVDFDNATRHINIHNPLHISKKVR